MRCVECKGSGEYRGLMGPVESCRVCGGSGEVLDGFGVVSELPSRLVFEDVGGGEVRQVEAGEKLFCIDGVSFSQIPATPVANSDVLVTGDGEASEPRGLVMFNHQCVRRPDHQFRLEFEQPAFMLDGGPT